MSIPAGCNRAGLAALPPSVPDTFGARIVSPIWAKEAENHEEVGKPFLLSMLEGPPASSAAGRLLPADRLKVLKPYTSAFCAIATIFQEHSSGKSSHWKCN